jgi:hypothetical protein
MGIASPKLGVNAMKVSEEQSTFANLTERAKPSVCYAASGRESIESGPVISNES